MKLRLILFFALFGNLPTTVLGCDCKQLGNLRESQKSNYEMSDFIFLGRLIELKSNGNFKFQIIETFKGKTREYIQAAYTHSCSILPSEDEEYWLVYIDEPNNDEPAVLSSCGLSRSFKYPYLMNINDLPPPPPPEEPLLQLESEILMSKHRIKHLKILKAEIKQLRDWRSER